MILAGDIGGTKIHLALLRAEDDTAFEFVRERRFETARFEGLAAVVRAFLEDGDESAATACFGVAGPVVGETIELTNAGWSVDRSRLREAIGVERVDFLNDLEATGYGIDALPDDQLAVLEPGRPHRETGALIAAGTGLGMATLAEFDGRSQVLPSEGGHADFAPRDDEELALWDFLRARYGHVSAERVVSGPGIRNVYEFLKETGREEEPSWLADRLAEAEDVPAAISDAAIDEEASICERALEIFVGCYGAVAGNLALTTLALRGLWVGGGIAPAILSLMKDRDRFLRAFRDKGRLADLLADVPVAVVLEERTAVLGAARYARLVAER
ncbi:MAG: glucokinase [Gemmatimonadetes bacterium]|nr:glucokinase [Gemmatimonadota bacterium]